MNENCKTLTARAERIAALEAELAALKKTLYEKFSQEKPSMWFYPKKGEEYAVVTPSPHCGWVFTIGTVAKADATRPVLRPERAPEWCNAMSLITSLRMECDEVTDEEQWVMGYDGALVSYSRKEYKGADVHGIVKNTEAELRAILNKHGGAEKVLAALQTLGSR